MFKIITIRALLVWSCVFLVRITIHVDILQTSFLTGILVGLLIDILYHISGFSKYESEYGLEPFEHYHTGLILCGVSIIFDRLGRSIGPVFFASGLLLIFLETFQDHPFAAGSGHERESDMIGLLIESCVVGLWIIFNVI